MEYTYLGRTGVQVSRLCLGCMNFGTATDEATSIRMIHRALDAGINFLDTANVYGRGRSEEIVGKAIKGRRDQVFLATKARLPMGDGPNQAGASRYHLMKELEASLRRLGTDHVDLYQIHRPDPHTPLDETLRCLDDCIRQGKIRYIGTSTFPAWQLCESLWISDRLGLNRFVCEQAPYNLLNREIEKELLPFAQRFGFGVIVWSPLAAGWLTGKYQAGSPPPSGSRGERRNWDLNSELSRRRAALVQEFQKLASRLGITVSQLALAWILGREGITAPIIGPRTPEQLEDNLGALGHALPPDVLETIDQLVPSGTAVHPMW